MKKILSLILALILTCSVLAAAGPALQATAAWEPVEIFAYDSEGNMTALDMSALPSNIKVTYTNEYFDSYKRNVDVKLRASDDYEAYYFKVNTDMLRVFIDGTVTLQAKKMTQEGETYYACLAANKDMRIYAQTFDYDCNLKLIAGTPLPSKELDAPVTLLTAKDDVVQMVSKTGEPKLIVDVSILMQSLEHTNGYTVSLAPDKLLMDSVNNVTLNYVTRTPVELKSTTEIHAQERSHIYVEFNGLSGGATSESTSFKKVILYSNFGGAVYNKLYRGGAYDIDTTPVSNLWISSIVSGETVYADYISKLCYYVGGDEHNITAAYIKDALDSKIKFQIGQTLPGFILGTGFYAKLEWRSIFNDTDLTGTAIEGGKAYIARISIVPSKNYCYRNLNNDHGQGNVEDIKPEAAYKASSTKAATDQQYDPLFIYYPVINPVKAPAFTQDPADQHYNRTQYGTNPASVSFTVKAINDETATYQWYKNGTKLADGDTYQGVNTNVLVVKDFTAAYDSVHPEKNVYWCELSSPLYPTVKSGEAKLIRHLQIDNVLITGLDKPAENKKPDTSFNMSFTPSYGGMDVKRTVVYSNATTGEELASDYTFKRGDKVKITITLEMRNQEYVFLKDVFRATWDEGGQMWLADTPDAYTATFSFNATVDAAPGEISFVNLSLAKPVVGEKLSYNIETPDNADYLVFDVVPSPYDTYAKAGTAYTYQFRLKANTGCYFADDVSIRLNGSLLTPTFNSDKTIATVSYTFPAQTAEIKSIELNAVIPQVGDVFDESKYSVTPVDADKDKYGLGAGTWEVELDKDGKVLEGCTRGMRLTLNAKEGYTFTPSTSIIIHYLDENGKAAHRMLNNDLTANARSIDLLALFDPCPPVHEHEGVTYYQIDGNSEQHYFNCKLCHELIYEDHTPGDWIVDKPATATEDGSKHKECTKCHYVLETEVIPKGSAPDVMLGDVDDDKNITASDARLALRRAVDLETFAPGSREFIACDVDKDGSVTANDARSILRAAVDLEDPKSW